MRLDLHHVPKALTLTYVTDKSLDWTQTGTMGILDGKAALISGSSRGIGQAVAIKLASAGARVVINGTDKVAVDQTVSDICANGGHAVPCIGDVRESRFAETFVNAAVNAFGGIDIIVNNAGFVWDSVIQKMTDEQWDSVLDIHLGAPFRILRAAQPLISAAAKQAVSKGNPIPCRKVVNVSSISGLTGNAGQVNYSSAKAGLSGLTKTLSKEWGRYNVTVNCVAFGLIETRTSVPLTDGSTIQANGRKLPVGLNPDVLTMMKKAIPLRRVGNVEEAAGAVYLFCVPESDYITGETILCSGGLLI